MYYLGAMRQVGVIAASAGARPRVQWLFRPGMRMIALQLADFTLMGKWESSDDSIAASIAVKVN